MAKHTFDVVVIGSGFGGSVSALRLREKGYSVAVLEAGRRFEEKDFPKTIAQGANDVLLMGDIEEFTFDHVVQAEFDLNDLHPKESFLNCLYYGRVTDMEYDKATGMVTIRLGDVKKVTASKRVKHENQPALH